MTELLLKKLSRITSSGHFIPEIDGLRFILIAWVVIHHLIGYLAEKLDYHPGGWGLTARPTVPRIHEAHFTVQLFFAISGFVLALPFASHYLCGTARVQLRKYFLRRVTRLEPPYVLVMLALSVGLVAFHRTNSRDVLPHLLAGLCYSHNLIYGAVNPINASAWSLEIEIQFYLLVPLLAQLFALRNLWIRRSVIVGIAVAAVLYQLLFLDASGRWGLTIINFLQLFLAGFLLADVFLTDLRERPGHSWRWDVVSVAGWPILFFVWRDYPRLSAALLPVLTFILYVATFRSVLFNKFFTNLWITVVGGMCYSIYLLHYPIISFTGPILQHFKLSTIPPVGFVLEGVLLILCVLGVSTAYFKAIERPCMRRDWPLRLKTWIRYQLGSRARSGDGKLAPAND